MSAYCDYNAGAPVRPEAAEAAARALALGGNPSSVHARGRAARACVEGAREAIAAALHAPPADVIFTSGATEALQLAVDGARAADRDLVVFRSEIEHAALAERPCDGIFRVDENGVADLFHLEVTLNAAKGRPLVALMLANNETGVIQPVAEAARLVKRFGGLLLCDAAQAFGRMEVSAADIGADYLVVSSHKIGGPPGAGALVLGCDAPFASPRPGGGQERGRRSGTENVPAIAGFAAAAALAEQVRPAEAMRLARLRDGFEAALREYAPDVEVIAVNAPRLCNTSLFALPGVLGETMVIALDLAGVCVSAGAACSAGKVSRRNRVLEAMNAPDEQIVGAVRASFGWNSTSEDAQALAKAVARISRDARVLAREVGR
ncbi:MAG: cysteine desulfurase family protein [Hyphomonadaceae bacterium]